MLARRSLGEGGSILASAFQCDGGSKVSKQNRDNQVARHLEFRF